MTSNSSSRVYLGTINPGGSLTQSGTNVRVRPYTTPAAPGRTSIGSSNNNALTVLSSHPTSLKNTISPQDEDLVLIEDEVSSASSSFSSRSSRRSFASSESISSVSVNTPVRQGPAKAIPTPAPLFVERRGKESDATVAISMEATPHASGSSKQNISEDVAEDVVRKELAQSSSAAIIAEASRRVRPVLDSTKQKTKTQNSLSPKRAPKQEGRSKEQSDNRKPLAKQSSPVSPGPSSSKLVSSRATDAKKRPATAGVTSKPKCVSLGRKELIGKGSFGMVYKALDLETNRLLAVKEIPLDGPNLQQLPTVRREILLMEKLSHPNIVQCLGHDLDDQYLRIYMEFVAGGCVSSLLKNFGRFQERQASIVTKQVLSGLQYLHDRKIAHRDLKGDNILLQPDGTVKLADFGTARELATTAMSLAGTAYFMAPEMIKGTGHGLEADIWSVGCCIIEMLTGKPPFSHLVNQYAIMTHIAESDGPYDDAFPTNCSPQVVKILKQCLVKDPSKRATCRQLLNEEWIVNPPPNTDMKGPLVLEQLTTVSEVRERVRQSKPEKAGSPHNFNSSSGGSSLTNSKLHSIRGSADQPLSSFNPMVEE